MKIIMGVDHLSPGTRTALLRFERAVREYAVAITNAPFDASDEREHYRHMKRLCIRRLRRLEGTLPPDTRRKRVKDNPYDAASAAPEV